MSDAERVGFERWLHHNHPLIAKDPDGLDRLSRRLDLHNTGRDEYWDSWVQTRYEMWKDACAWQRQQSSLSSEDMVLVPKYPTDAMGKASAIVHHCACGRKITQWGCNAWRSMLEAWHKETDK